MRNYGVIFLVVSFLAGCGGNPLEKKLVGKWQWKDNKTDASIEIRPDHTGTFSMKDKGQPPFAQEVTWSVEGEAISIKPNGYQWKLNGDALEGSGAGETVSYTRVP